MSDDCMCTMQCLSFALQSPKNANKSTVITNMRCFESFTLCRSATQSPARAMFPSKTLEYAISQGCLEPALRMRSFVQVFCQKCERLLIITTDTGL